MDDLQWLVREHLGEDAEVLARDSGAVGRAGAAAGMLAGGLHPDEVARAVRRTRARVVHAHNLQPTFGWRALAAARSAGAAVVMHVHQYRMVCAIGICFRDGQECTRCHARNTLPGVRLNCRGAMPEAIAYGAGLAAWQRRLAAQVDVFLVPSRFAHARLVQIGAPLTTTRVMPNVIREFAADPAHRGSDPDPGDPAHRGADPDPADPARRGPALLAARLVAEKGIEVAVRACRIAGIPLVVAGEGPARDRLDTEPAAVRFVGRVSRPELARLRQTASIALVPSLSAETFGLAAAEAMAAGLPVAASRIGALPELVPDEWLAAPGDAAGLAAVIRRVAGDPGAGRRAVQRVRELTAPETVAPALAAAYSDAHERARASGRIGRR